MVTTIKGLESLILNNNNSNFNYYIGEILTAKLSGIHGVSAVDILVSTATGQQYWGDNFLQPFMLTPNDDHN